jgi:hypothetical protein
LTSWLHSPILASRQPLLAAFPAAQSTWLSPLPDCSGTFLELLFQPLVIECAHSSYIIIVIEYALAIQVFLKPGTAEICFVSSEQLTQSRPWYF